MITRGWQEVGELGLLRLNETYLHYDGPRIFSSTSGTGKLFLGVFIEESGQNDNEFDRYLVVSISKTTLQELKAGNRTIREVIMISDQKHIYVVTARYNPLHFEVVRATQEDVDDNMDRFNITLDGAI